jgi:hypothetical protein
VDGAGHRLVTQHEDHPLDLPPPAEMDDIAHVPAAAGEPRRFCMRELAEPVDQLPCFLQSGAVGEMDIVTQSLTPRHVL